MNALSVGVGLLFLSLVACANAQCNGGYPEGHILEQDPYWYECSGGKMQPRGCMTDTGRRIRTNELYDGSNYAWKCVNTPQGHLSIEMAACLKDGRRVRPGETFTVDDYWYECKQSGRFLNGRVGGCVVNGRRSAIEEKVRKDDNVWRCQMTPDGRAELVTVGCLFNGREYRIGSTFDDGKFFYTCRTYNDKSVVKVLGCVFKSKRLSAFQNYYDGDQMYRCLFTVDLKKAQHVLEGCVKNDPYSGQPVEKKIGCVWEDGRPPYLYLSECVNQTNRAVVNKIRCKYDGPEGTAEIMAGCWTRLGNLGVGCKHDVNEGMKIVTFDGTDESNGHRHGLSNWLDNRYACTVFARSHR